MSAALFNAAVRLIRQTYGDAAAVERVTITARGGLRFSLDVPHGWEPSDTPALTASAACIADVLATLVDDGKRMTRAALMTAMEKAGRSRAESTVSDALADLTRLGLIDNRQDTAPKGYGLPEWS